MKKYVAILVVLSALALQGVEAQNRSRSVVARFLFLERHQGKPDLHTLGGEDSVKIEMPVENFSRQQRIVLKNGTAYFFKLIQDPTGERREEKKVVASVKVPSSYQEVFFYFEPKAKGEEYHVRVMADDYRHFPQGGVRVLNLSSHLLRFDVGEHRGQKVKSRSMVVLPKVSRKDRYNMAQTTFHFAAKKQWHKVSEFKKQFTDSKRMLIVAFLDRASGIPQIRTYDDVLPPSEPPALRP